jgi:deoxyribodipyrimidine photolyase
VNDNKIEASGVWEYIDPPTAVSTKNNRKHKSKGGSSSRDNDSDNNDNGNRFKTKEDELAVSEIENILSERFKEYSKQRDFIIHESKTSILSLNIQSIEVVKE